MNKFDSNRIYSTEEIEDIMGWKFGTGNTFYKHMRILKDAYDVEILQDSNDHRRRVFRIRSKKKDEETDFRKYNHRKPRIDDEIVFKIWDRYLSKKLNGLNQGTIYFGSALMGKVFLGIDNKRALYEWLEREDIPWNMRKKIVNEVYDKAKELIVDKLMKHHGYSKRSKVLICVPKQEEDCNVEDYVVDRNYMWELYNEYLDKKDAYSCIFSGLISSFDIHNIVLDDLKKEYPEYKLFFMYHIYFQADGLGNLDVSYKEVKLYQRQIRKIVVECIKEKYIKKSSQSIEDIASKLETGYFSEVDAKNIKLINDEMLSLIIKIEKGFIGSCEQVA